MTSDNFVLVLHQYQYSWNSKSSLDHIVGQMHDGKHSFQSVFTLECSLNMKFAIFLVGVSKLLLFERVVDSCQVERRVILLLDEGDEDNFSYDFVDQNFIIGRWTLNQAKLWQSTDHDWKQVVLNFNLLNWLQNFIHFLKVKTLAKLRNYLAQKVFCLFKVIVALETC